MLRSYLIILVPAVLVAAGYLVVLRQLGLPPGYPRLAVAALGIVAGTWWLGRRGAKRPGPR